ncbi:MAG: Mrp/NBP35 family ATP-binding protein [Lachnospiraceae bacterium]|nr:Mrp/NBP35 family ATP-binding protein [Lachnospiraceae bacterium]MDY5498104.1 Mrp/NBP35 family ATP-binding protein [Anaerobutyricum sp.]
MSDNCSHNCSECGSDCSERTAPQSLLEPLNKNSSVKKVIGVVSGKGGVGKSLVTAMLAVLTQREGYRTAILDADITGPSIPKVFGIHGKALGCEDGILPAETKSGTKIMSINLLLDHEGDPVVWRGPIITGAVKQFWTDVNWGTVDYMFVDMPPGTSDVPLTVFQSLPIDGIIVVASPQELVEMIVEKAVRMAEMMHVPVLGLVENMSYFECPTCHDKHFIFGQSHIAELAARFQIDSTAQIPIEPALAALCDQGNIEAFTGDWLDRMLQFITFNGEKL